MPPAANVSPARLRRLHDILRDLPKDASTNALYDGVCQVELSDPSYVFQLVFSRGRLEIIEGRHDLPAATVALKFDAFLEMATGKLDTRNIPASGERLFAMRAFLFLNQPLEGTLAGYRCAEQRAAARSAPIRTIERASQLTREHLLDALQDGRPVIYSGLVSADELRAWTPASLMSNYADVVTEAPGMQLPMGRLLADIMSGGRIRNAGAPVPAELLPQVAAVPFLTPSKSVVHRLWIASAGLYTGLHRDPVHGLLAHYYGTKAITLYSPDQARYLYPYQRFRAYQPCAVYNIEQPDLEAFPLFAQAEPLKETLRPGEALLIPHGWFHFLKSETLTVSVSIPSPPQESRASRDGGSS
jgi:hypothetical protein